MITGNIVDRLNSEVKQKPNRRTPGEQQPVNRSRNQIQTLRPIANRNKQSCQERLTVHQTLDQWRSNNHHSRKQNTPLVESSANSRRGNVEDRQTLTNYRN